MDRLQPPPKSEGVLRKLAVVALLGAGAWVASGWLPSSVDAGPPGLVAVGFALLASFGLGQLAVRLRLPALTGYVIAGLLLGSPLRAAIPDSWLIEPLSWRVIDSAAAQLLQPIEQIAIGLIALTVGGLVRLDAARTVARTIGGVLLGQVVAVFAAVLLWGAVIGMGLPYVTMPGFEGIGSKAAIGISALIAVFCLSGSPAATLAVLHGTGARGPISRLVLNVVVLKELVVVLLFALVTPFVLTTPPAGSTLSVPVYVLAHVGAALALGTAVGVGIALYLRRVRREVPLFVIAAVVLTAFIAERVGLPPVAVLLPAGIIAANAVGEGEKLVREVAKLSTPLYLVYFTMFGARLRVDHIVALAPFALALVALRMLAIRLGVAAGARASNADTTTVRFGWGGFVPQSGVVIGLVGLLGNDLGEAGAALAALVLAAVGLNELIGPVLFRLTLGRAGELPARATRGQDVTEEEAEEAATAVDSGPASQPASMPPPPTEPWPEAHPVKNPWGDPPKLASRELNQVLTELEADLQALARDVASGKLESFRKDALAYYRQLRMELLRHHRRVSNQLVSPERAGESAIAILRGERADLADRWSSLVQGRGARVAIDKWRPTKILEAVDELAEDTPEFVEAPYEPQSFDHPEGESALRSIRRLGLRVRRRWASFTDGTEPSRSVAIGALVRYHLMGKLPARVEGIAALFVDAEQQIVDRTRDLFDAVAHGYLTLSERFPEGGDDPELRAQLALLRRAFEVDLAAAVKEVGQIVEDGTVRTACVLGEVQQAIKREAAIMSTLDLPGFSRRFSLVHAERDRARARLLEGFTQAREVNAAQYSLLALEFEMGSLEGHIEGAVHTFASELGRSIDGRAHHQLGRITAALDEAVGRYEQLFDSESTGVVLAAAIRDTAKPLERVVSEAVRASLLLRDQLTDEHGVAPLLDTLARSARVLTDHYRIPSARPARGAWRLPPSVHVVEVPFRQLVQGHVETAVSPHLLHVLRELTSSVQPLAAAIEELDRRVSFNVEVAVAEVDEFETEPVALETRALVREMIVGALQRSRKRFGELEATSVDWGNAARAGVRGAVVGDLEELRWQLVEGRVGELRSRLARSTDRRWWLEHARSLPATLARAREEAEQLARSAVGGERIERVRLYLGLPGDHDVEPEPKDFARPGETGHLPMVYRRLFSAQALEAGDLLVGRTDAVNRARKTLSGAGSKLRAVALVGPDGVGKGAVANAIVRGIEGSKAESWTFVAPVSTDEVDAWFATPRENRLITVSGFHWLVSARPGGAEPLRRFVAGVVADGGKNAWLVRTDLLVWRFMSALSSVDDAFPEVVELQPFDVLQLEAAVLARHAMSGHDLAFGPSERSGRMAHELGRKLLGTRARQAWFRDLHEASGGLIRDALLLWMASVEKVDEEAGKVWMGRVPSPPSAAIRNLSEDVLLTLWQVARNGWTDPDVHAALFRMSPNRSQAHLTRLVHWGILTVVDGKYRITVHLRGAVVRVMVERGWVR